MNKNSFWYRNSLSIVFLIIFLFSLGGQAYTGWDQYNQELVEKGGQAVTFEYYLTTGHFISATFENWQSEFLQMALYVLLTVFLRQKGSSESKALEGTEEVDREPHSHGKAPWPVKKGGIWLRLYNSSLTIAFFLLFFMSITIHAYSSLHEYNAEERLLGKQEETIGEYIKDTKFWFETFQNWQSEFISVFSIVILSIFLRQKGSPESKPVDAPHDETGS